MLVEWKNLNTIQDTRKVSSIEEFKNKKFRYQMSKYSVEIERLVLRLENLCTLSEDVKQAHRMSAMVFGMERPYHLLGALVRETRLAGYQEKIEWDHSILDAARFTGGVTF